MSLLNECMDRVELDQKWKARLSIDDNYQSGVKEWTTKEPGLADYAKPYEDLNTPTTIRISKIQAKKIAKHSRDSPHGLGGVAL